jgi:hypothetical protein
MRFCGLSIVYGDPEASFAPVAVIVNTWSFPAAWLMA